MIKFHGTAYALAGCEHKLLWRSFNAAFHVGPFWHIKWPLLHCWTPTLQYRIPHLYHSSLSEKLVMKFALFSALISLASFSTASVLPRQFCAEASRFGNLIVTSPSGATSYNAGDASPHFFLLAHSHLWTVVSLAHRHPRWPHLCHPQLRNYTKVHGLHHPSPRSV